MVLNGVPENETVPNNAMPAGAAPTTKFCKHCGGVIPVQAVFCTLCGGQVEEVQQAPAQQPQIIIDNKNINSNVNTNVMPGRLKNKWVALLLCLFLGFLGGHKFYEGKIGMGVLYLFTCGLFTIGAIIDFIVLLFKPTNYYV